MPIAARSIVFVLALLVAVFPVPAKAQDHRATLRGVVLDPALQGLPTVELKVTQEDTGETRRTTTDSQGRFTVPELSAGVYRINIEHSGYGPFVARAELSMGQEFWLQVPLQIGAVIQAVDVTVPFIPVDYDTPALHTFISERQITGLPLDGRNFLELALLAPGTAPPPQGSASTSRGDFALSINGAREDFTGFLLDGVYNADPKLNTPSVRPPVDAIRQFQVLTSTYDASFGRNAGGQINVITQSGANRFSGSAYEFIRNGSLDARNYFAPKNEPAPRYDRHQFGGSIRRATGSESHLLLRRLRADAFARGDHSRDQRADACRADRRLFGHALQSAVQFPGWAAISRRHHSTVFPKLHRRVRSPRVPRAEPRYSVRELRLVADPARRRRPGGCTDRSFAERRRQVHRALQPERSSVFRPVRGAGVCRHSRVRDRRAAAWTEPRRNLHSRASIERGQRSAFRLQPGVDWGLCGKHRNQQCLCRPEAADHHTSRRRAERDFCRRLFTAGT